MATSRIDGNLRVIGDIRRTGVLLPAVKRSEMEQEQLVRYPIPWENWRVWDAYQTLIPGVPLTDDLGLIGGTFSVGVPSLQTEDLKAAGATNSYARTMIAVPAEYDSGADLNIRVIAGMLTTVADVTATVDVECFKSDLEGLVDGADLVTTAAQTINSVVLANKDFVMNGGAISPGDILDLRVIIAINDGASVTVVKAIIGAIWMLFDVRG